MYNRNRITIALAFLLTATFSALAGTPSLNTTAAPAPDDLTLGNFLSQGWDTQWTLRSSLPDGAPDLPLFHSPTNFLFRGSRTDYAYQPDLTRTGIRNVQFLDEYIDYAFNQRFMLSLFGNYTWVNNRTAADQDGAAGGAMGRFQLIDTPTSSDSLNLRVDVPNKSIGIDTTKLTAALAGWQDLSTLGAGRVGLYYDIEENAYAGNETPGISRDDCAYDLAIARTWTPGDAAVANLTTFAEFAGATSMQGVTRSRTDLTVTPAVQFILGKRNLVMLGVDFPLTHPSGARDVYRITYVYCF